MRFTFFVLFFVATAHALAPRSPIPSTATASAMGGSAKVLHSSIAAQDLMGSSNSLYPAWASMTSSTTAVVDQFLDKIKPSTRKNCKQGNKEVVTDNAYVRFAQRYPFINNLLIATLKSGAADFMAQTVMGGAALTQLHLSRSAIFMAFGAVYCGGFQWLYQVCLFSKLFPDVESFTRQSWSQKLRDRKGLVQLVAQTALDLTVLAAAYLPIFYVFQASVLDAASNPMSCIRSGLARYQANFATDALNIVRIWLPADLLCFSVPLYLRLPVRHGIGFAWTAFLSFARGGM